MIFRLALLTAATCVFPPLSMEAFANCGFGDINASNARVGVVQPPAVHFVENDTLVKGCPNASAMCQKKGYVVRGDILLIGPTQGDYVCTGYVTSAGHSLNEWLPSVALKLVSLDQKGSSDWAGKWTSDDSDITIAAKENTFLIQGEAEWKGDISVHTGELKGVATPANGVMAFTMGDDKTLPFTDGHDFDCRVSMVRRGPYLIVDDNRQCGGANVTFTGFYRRSVGKKH